MYLILVLILANFNFYSSFLLQSKSALQITVLNKLKSSKLDGLKNDIKLKRSNYSFTGDPNLLSSFTRSTLLGYLLYASPISAQEIVGLTSTTVGIPDYLKYFLSGAICCSFSHGIGVPFDVVKTKKQISKDMSKLGILEIFKKIIADDGVGMLFKGLGPTVIGYSIQGSLKFGFYEIFKNFLMTFLVPDESQRIAVYMLAGACAELVGSTFLSPFEACRIRLIANPQYADGLFPCLIRIKSTEGLEGLFRGLPAILAKQVPYTVVQLSVFETVANTAYSYLNHNGLLTSDFRWIITLVAAMTAALLSSLASQPGDTLLSAVNKQTRARVVQSQNDSPSNINTVQIMKESIMELGLTGLFTGTKARLLHVGVIVVVQLVVYDYIKQLCGIPLSH